MSTLRVSGLHKQFISAAESLTVLDGIDLEMSAGEDLAIVGPSGSGKSTLLHILGTLDSPTSGSVEVAGVNPFALSPTKLAAFRNQTIGFIFQDHHLLPQLTVAENVLLPAIAQGRPSEKVRQRAQQLIQEVGLAQRELHLPSQLSGGERQRVAIARALLNHPKLVLADEPTGNLDAANTQSVARMLFDLPKREQAMLILVTHSDWLAEQAQRCVRIEDRRLVVIR